MNNQTIILDAAEHASFLAEGRRDPLSHAILNANDEVVVCGNCLTVFHKDTWTIPEFQHPCGKNNTINFIPNGYGPQIVYFEATPQTFTGATPVILKWEIVQSPREVTLNGEVVRAHGQRTEIPNQSTTYELRARNSFGNCNKIIQVLTDIHDPEIVHFNVSPNFLESKKPVTISWEVKYAERIYIEPGIGEISSSQGSKTLFPTRDTVFTIRAFNFEHKLAERSEEVRVSKIIPEIVYFEPETHFLEEEKLVKIKWEVTGAESVSINPTPGLSENEGETAIEIRKTTLLSLNATSWSGVTAKSTFEIKVTERKPEISYFVAIPGTILPGQSSMLKWKTRDIGSMCIASILPEPGPVKPQGEIQINPYSDTIYRISVTNYFSNTNNGITHVRVIQIQEKEFLSPQKKLDNRLRILKLSFDYQTEKKFNGEKSYKSPEKNFLSISPKNKTRNS